MNVVQAIGHSCNNFYYDVGFRLGLLSDGTYSSDQGIERISKYAEMFGLGEVSGLEIPEREPQIANKGTVYDLTLLYKVTDVDGNIIKEYEPSVYKEIQEDEISQSTFNLIHNGMDYMVEKDTRFAKVRAAGLQMAGKTGTAQQSNTHADHVLFVGYAPSAQPEIAFSCRIANGYSSGYTADIGRDMVLKYYALAEDSELVTGSASSLGVETHGD